MRIIILSFLLLLHIAAMAQYAPQAGLAGSTAISTGSSAITGWATNCTVQRGYIDIANQPLGNVTGGADANATGAANGSIVCLGDSGIATLTFAAALYNGTGADFAVFENGFKDPADPAMAFLELAFVEVSSDGTNYFRFPANSNTQANVQIPGSGVYMDASLLNNLAGKYVASYGTPFDLQELTGLAGLDVNNITHIRLVDVVGAITAHSSHDNTGLVINDPYPTNFPTGGFDLDAVGAIHMLSTGLAMQEKNIVAGVYPNPTSDNITISIKDNENGLHATLLSLTGGTMHETPLATSTTIRLTSYPAGMYYLIISDTNGTQWAGKVIKY